MNKYILLCLTLFLIKCGLDTEAIINSKGIRPGYSYTSTIVIPAGKVMVPTATITNVPETRFVRVSTDEDVFTIDVYKEQYDTLDVGDTVIIRMFPTYQYVKRRK